MKILITGAGGQLGYDCQLVLRGHKICACSSSELDITRKERVEQTVVRCKPEIIINCAAYTAVDRCESDQQRCLAVNAEGPAHLADIAHKQGARIIHISTDYVFDGARPVPEPYRESDTVSPLSAYGRSKLAGEEAVRSLCPNHLIIRTAWLYGKQGKNFLKTMLRLALQQPGKTIRVVNDQFGSMTWTYRLAMQIQTLIQSELRGTVHATAEGFASWYQVARCFLEAMDLEQFSLAPCTTADYPTPAHRPANSILANSVLMAHGLNCMQPWEDDVRQFARSFREELLTEARG